MPESDPSVRPLGIDLKHTRYSDSDTSTEIYQYKYGWLCETSVAV
jgi:hypothetical protein